MKRCLSKQIGKALLTYDELKDALISVETCMNNRPITYLGEEAEQKVLTPNTLIKGSPTRFPEEDLDKVNYLDEDKLVTRRMIYMKKTRELLKQRWLNEYLRGLKDQRNKIQPQEIPNPGDVVLMTDSLAGKGFKPQWSIARVLSHIRGRDGVVRGLRLKSSKGYEIERPLELIRPLEIQCTETTALNDVTTASADDETTFIKEDGVKSRYTRAKQIRDDSTSTKDKDKDKEHPRGKRQAASNARAINKTIQEEELQL